MRLDQADVVDEALDELLHERREALALVGRVGREEDEGPVRGVGRRVARHGLERRLVRLVPRVEDVVGTARGDFAWRGLDEVGDAVRGGELV